MSKQQHTPGPWHVVLSDNATPHILHEHGCDSSDCGDLSSRVCVMPAEIVADYNSLANASLIAAAPELLEALEAVLSAEPADGAYLLGETESERAAYANARAAIAKARGES